MPTNGQSFRPKEMHAVFKLGGHSFSDEYGAVNEESIRSLFDLIVAMGPEHFLSLGFVLGGGDQARKEMAGLGNVSSRKKDLAPREKMLQRAEAVRDIASDYGFNTVSRVPRTPWEAEQFAQRKTKKTVSLNHLKPGQSSDASAAWLLKYFLEGPRNTKGKDAEAVILYLTNVLRLCLEDPRKNPDTRAVKTSSFQRMVSKGTLSDRPEEFKPGMSVPIDMKAVYQLLRLERKGYVPRTYFGAAGTEHLGKVRQFLMGQQPDDGTVLDPRNKRTVYYKKQDLLSDHVAV